MSTHAAVVTVAPRAPLEILEIPTIPPTDDEVLVRVEWTASTPLDLHQNDGGLLVNHPQVLGDGIAGTVLELGPEAKRLKVGDKVFGFAWRFQKEKAHQEKVIVSEYLLGKIPSNTTPQAAVTLPNNLVTVFHAFTTDLGIPLPYPIPSTPVSPTLSTRPILIWGGSSSVGQYAIQILHAYHHTNIISISSQKHFPLLTSYGATKTLDYNSPTIIPDIVAELNGKEPLVLDCIGSQNGSLVPLSKVVGKGAVVAVLLPVVVRDASVEEAPVYAMDAGKAVEWEEGVEVRGVRTHFYLDNPFFKEKLQSEIQPALLSEGIIKPNRYRIVEGKTLLERAQAAMDILRRKEVSGERLVWRVSEEDVN